MRISPQIVRFGDLEWVEERLELTKKTIWSDLDQDFGFARVSTLSSQRDFYGEKSPTLNMFCVNDDRNKYN